MWKNYKNIVLVNENGEVKSIARTVKSKNNTTRQIQSRVLATSKQNGYSRVSTKVHGKMYHLLVHRMVAELFIPNPSNLSQVNHKDGNKTNPMYTNLEWVTPSQNQYHAYKTKLQKPKFSKLSQEHKDVIKTLRPYITLNNAEIGKLFNVSANAISNICLDKSYDYEL